MGSCASVGAASESETEGARVDRRHDATYRPSEAFYSPPTTPRGAGASEEKAGVASGRQPHHAQDSGLAMPQFSPPPTIAVDNGGVASADEEGDDDDEVELQLQRAVEGPVESLSSSMSIDEDDARRRTLLKSATDDSAGLTDAANASWNGWHAEFSASRHSVARSPKGNSAPAAATSATPLAATSAIGADKSQSDFIIVNVAK